MPPVKVAPVTVLIAVCEALMTLALSTPMPRVVASTVTAGIISARARDINAGPSSEFLQTDAPINRGNSGGPMFNMDGEVVGVNTASFSPSGGSIGIGFAIPSALAKNIVKQLRAQGHIKQRLAWRAYPDGDAGYRRRPRSRQAARRSRFKRDARRPRRQGGVQPGDVILSGSTGKEIPEMHRLPLIVAETEVNKTVNVTVYRKGGDVQLKVKVGELQGKDDTAEDQEKATKTPAPTPSAEKVEELGLSAAPLTDALRARSIKKDVAGIVVTAVTPGRSGR